MTPAEHRAKAEELLEAAERIRARMAEAADEGNIETVVHLTDVVTVCLSGAQVHATLALAPQQPAQPPQQTRWDTSREETFVDVQGEVLNIWPTANAPGVLIGHPNGEPWFFETPRVLRTLASLLTAHADRLEPKP